MPASGKGTLARLAVVSAVVFLLQVVLSCQIRQKRGAPNVAHTVASTPWRLLCATVRERAILVTVAVVTRFVFILVGAIALAVASFVMYLTGAVLGKYAAFVKSTACSCIHAHI